MIKQTRFLLTLLLTLIFIGGQNSAFANNVVVAEDITSEISLTPYIELYEDHTQTLTVYDIATEKYDSKFTRALQQPNLGFSQSSWWVKVTIENTDNTARDYFIRQNHGVSDYLDLYNPVGQDKWQRLVSGDQIGFHQRPYNTNYPIFCFEIAANSTKTIYLRVKSKGIINIDFLISSQQGLVSELNQNQLMSGIFFGGILTLFIYNVFRLISNRNSATAYYLAYIAFTGTYFAALNGYVFQYIWPTSSWIANNSMLISLILSRIFWLKFSRQVLDLAHYSERTDNIAKLMSRVFIVLLVALPIFDYQTSATVVSIAAFLCLVFLLTIGVISFINGYRPARFYLAAISILAIGMAIEISRSVGLIDNNFVSQNIHQFANLISMTLLSLTLSINIVEDSRYNYVDPTTHLYNRLYFEERLESEFSTAIHQRSTLCLLLVNIDQVNQKKIRHSIRKSNRIARSVAYETEQILRKIHVAARYNQDELAILLPSSPVESAKIIAERIRQAVEEQTSTTVSIGIASYSPNDSSNPISDHRELLEAADKAMYVAITSGQNKFELYQADEEETA